MLYNTPSTFSEPCVLQDSTAKVVNVKRWVRSHTSNCNIILWYVHIIVIVISYGVCQDEVTCRKFSLPVANTGRFDVNISSPSSVVCSILIMI